MIFMKSHPSEAIILIVTQEIHHDFIGVREEKQIVNYSNNIISIKYSF